MKSRLGAISGLWKSRLDDEMKGRAWPRYVRIAARLPRTATNKVLKRELAADGPVPGTASSREREPRGRTYAAHR